MSSAYAARRSVMPKQRQPAPRRSQRPRPTPAARGTTDRVGSKGDEAKSPNEATTGAAADAVVAELRIGPGKQGAVATVRGTTRLIELAAKWMYILRNRSRWAKDDNLKINIGETAKDDLAELGIDEAAVMKICDSELRHVEVTFFDDHPTSRTSSPAQAAAMAFPWEFVLSSATRKGRAETLLVTRLLLRDWPRARGSLDRLLFVESAPGRLQGFYSFASERARLRAATGRREWALSESDSLRRLPERILMHTPNVIHLSAIDNHQAAQIIPGFYDDPEIRKALPNGPDDGMMMRRVSTERSLPPEEPVPYDKLAENLIPDRIATRPWLVTCNLYYSSARIAQECIRRGAQAAIGFQDEVDDELAELFFQEFYRAWYADRSAGLPKAFGQAWKALQTHRQQLFGTGIVLWLAVSAFDGQRRPALGRREEMDVALAKLPTDPQRKATRRQPITEVLQVELKVPPTVNYSLLHNARPFLTKFTLNKLVKHTLDEITVTVDLNVGDGSLPFRYTERLLESSQRDVSRLVRVPLTAPLLRSLRERVQTTLYAKVSWDGRVAHESTESVTLLPVDEWLDDTKENPWLPSFVLPRDPAIVKIISAARQYLVTLLDDTTASFDGYQSVTGERTPPLENVDLQVRAIWAALVNEFKLLYINPPPAYSKQSQRLRTPSEILDSGSGTCIDLALLLAACLEYIEVYPVLVLLSGHCFVGYWRNCDNHEEFRRVRHVPKSTPTEVGRLSRASAVSLVDEYEWRLTGQQFDEIRHYLRTDKLLFLEATGLCFEYSFADALEEGASNLSRADFDSLLDIRLARTAEPPVTPLPIIGLTGGGKR